MENVPGLQNMMPLQIHLVQLIGKMPLQIHLVQITSANGLPLKITNTQCMIRGYATEFLLRVQVFPLIFGAPFRLEIRQELHRGRA
jgi:hypothetical protein